jgi:hypothetical protein
MLTGGVRYLVSFSEPSYNIIFSIENKTVRSFQQIYKLTYLIYESPESAVGIAGGYDLDGREVGVRVPVGARLFSFSISSRPLLRPGTLLRIREIDVIEMSTIPVI